MTTGHAPEQVRHPTFKQYVMVAILLFAITMVEFLIIYPHQRITGIPLVVVLAVLSAIKFGFVIFFYMHLKFDARLFTWIFLGGLALAFAVVLALLGLFGSLQIEAQPRGFAEENRVPFIPFTHETDGQHGDGGGAKPETGGAGGPPDLLAQGKTVFNGTGTCFACHTIRGVSSGTVGPDLTHIGTEGPTHKPGMSAVAYIRESIEDPDAFVVSGFPPGVMPKGLKNNMSGQEFEALVAFLVAQK